MNQEITKLEKVKKSCKGVKIFSKVVGIICIAAAASTLLGFIIIAANRQKVSEAMAYSLALLHGLFIQLWIMAEPFRFRQMRHYKEGLLWEKLF